MSALLAALRPCPSLAVRRRLYLTPWTSVHRRPHPPGGGQCLSLQRRWSSMAAESGGLLVPRVSRGPLTPDEALKYGVLAQAAYDAYDRVRSTCRHAVGDLLSDLGLGGHGYVATASLYATVDADNQHHWFGYVAVADDDERDRAGGCRDVVVVWRGTTAADEWFEDFEARLVELPLTDGEGSARGPAAAPIVLVEDGFHSVYTTAGTRRERDATSNNAGGGDDDHCSSAKDQVLAELKRLVAQFRARGEKVRVTATGHSLGGALAVLTAWDAAAALSSTSGVGSGSVPVSAVTFGAPRVGNKAFCDELRNSRGVAVERVVVKQDVVPMMPLAFLGYADAGDDVLLLDADTVSSDYLQLPFHGPWHFHSLQLYLQLLQDKNR